MASWFDIIAFCLTVAAFIGAILGVKFIANKISSAVDATKESLKSKGLTIDDKGVSVRTTSRYSHEDYVDATQRGFIRAMGASVFGPADPIASSESSTATPKAPPLSRHGSSTSSLTNGSADTPEEKEKKRKHFSLRRGARS